MWRAHLATYCAFALTLLFPIAAFPHHPYSEYDPKAAPQIGIALSGGGLRAAAFSHGVMLELRKLCLIRPQEQSSASLDQDNIEDASPLYSLHYIEDTEHADDHLANPCGRDGGASFLDNVHFLSGVSGGAITAAYYKTHPDQLAEFGQKLKDARIAWKLFTGEKTTPIWRPPLMLFASMLDTLFQTFKLPLFPIPEIEVAPFATMALYDGLFESEQLAKVYSDLFLSNTTFGELEHPTKSGPTLAGAIFRNGGKEGKGIGQANLLINATDIANGRILTFDKGTFACLGNVDDFRKLQLSVAVAASSTLPGVFSPLHLKSYLTKTDSMRIPTSCPLILGDQVRSPVLVDGGVSDNLGVTGLLRAIFERKNTNGVQKDDRSITSGGTLEILESEEHKITRALLSSKDTKSLTTVQRENPKSQKTFLLVVNAGVTTTSSLPKLAGHLDNSFDVLIRDRTDLSRVIAQRMLRNFGFGVVELNMRDLVKSNRVVSRVVKLAMANHRSSKLTDEPVRQIAQTFDFTEMERKVLDDLNQIGFLPSKDEIDTLILAGRAVVAEMSGLIKQEYETLADKNYSASCESIINSDRHYCWPSSFETPHLAANKVGVLLDVLTKESEAFSKATSENRSNQLAQIKSNLTELYLNESWALDLPQETSIATPFLACRFKQDKLVAEALSMTNVENIPSCTESEGAMDTDEEMKKLLEAAPAWLRDAPKPTSDIQDDVQKYASNLLDPDVSSLDLEKVATHFNKWVSDVIKHMLKDENKPPSPMYYYFLARYSMLQKQFDDGFHYLYKGLNEFPDNFNLSYLLGYYSIYLHRDFQGGLGHLASAKKKAESKQLQVDLIKPDVLEDKSPLRKRFSRAVDRYTLLHAKYTALSPIPLKGRSEFTSDEEVDSWLDRTFPDGHGGNDPATLLQLVQQSRPTSGSVVAGPYCRIQETLKTPLLKEDVRDALQAFLNQYGDFECPNGNDMNDHNQPSLNNINILQGAPCGNTTDEKYSFMSADTLKRRDACRSFAKVRNAVRELLAYKNASFYARAQARRLYESASEDQMQSSPARWERADVYGLIVLIDAAQQACPQRNNDVRTALRLFQVARAAVGDDPRLKEPKYGTYVKKRIQRLSDITEELACTKDVD